MLDDANHHRPEAGHVHARFKGHHAKRCAGANPRDGDSAAFPQPFGFVTSAQKLRIASPTSLSATSVYRGAAVTIKGQVGNYWYVTFGSAWGFLPKSVVNDYPYGTYSGPSSKYYFMNRDKYVKVTSFKSGTARDPNEYKKNISDFWSKYNDADRKAKYQSIADQTDLPVILIAAIHYREKGGI